MFILQVQSQVIDLLKSVSIRAFHRSMSASTNITVALAENEASNSPTNASSSSVKGEIIDTKGVEKRQVGQGKAIIEIMKMGKSVYRTSILSGQCPSSTTS